jgi:hypothetical protein
MECRREWCGPYIAITPGGCGRRLFSGVARLDDLQTDHPHFITYTIADGLASNTTSCITEDKLGRMYFGTTRSLDRFDLETKRIRHYTKADGLASNAVRVALRDRQGALWFGTEQGLSRLIPTRDPPPSPPPILISGLRIVAMCSDLSVGRDRSDRTRPQSHAESTEH